MKQSRATASITDMDEEYDYTEFSYDQYAWGGCAFSLKGCLPESIPWMNSKEVTGIIRLPDENTSITFTGVPFITEINMELGGTYFDVEVHASETHHQSYGGIQ